jgi:eukaryotic-like serine/threonine-protein kinase
LSLVTAFMSRWQQVEKICQSALELEESRRAAFLKEACAGDEELRREVESLLRFDRHGDRFIEEPALEVAAKMIAEEKPESLVGQQLGSYQILSLLGTGGMGVVYKARDTRLNRSVAIKVLPADKVSDPERKRRFIQEARAASALNHPNIITIYDIGSAGGSDFIVMEHVAGKTLDQRIPRKGMKVNEALKLAIKMAAALAKAHSAGIIHRDLKPTNVMVTEDGLVKILDFGVAKLTEVESIEGETRTLQGAHASSVPSLTEEGMIIGTVSYMSPEQAEGKKVDARSDIFSFGAVLYEMVTGQKAFQGDSKVSTLAAILNKNPKPVIEINPGVPRELDRIINHCLRKDPARRFQHMDDVKVELGELKEESDSGKLAGAPQVVRPTRRRWVWAGSAFFVVAIAVGVWLFRGTDKKPAAAPEVVPLTSYLGFEMSPSFSPDGNQVVFSWNGEKQDNFDIYVKLVGSANYVRLTSDPADDVSPAFSPDGRSIGFVRMSKDHAYFMVIPSIGGPERRGPEIPTPHLFLDVYGFPPSFAWLPDGKRLVTDGLAMISMESGETLRLTPPTAKSTFDFSPSVSPDGHSVAFSRSAAVDVSDIYLLDLTEGLKPKGEPRRLTSLKGLSFGSTWTPNGGEIIFASGTFLGGMNLWKVRASGVGEPQRLPFGSGEARRPAISRTGSQLAYERRVTDINIWRLLLSGPGVAGGPPTRFIASTHWDSAAQYSPDGKRIAFESERTGVHSIWVSDADGLNVEELFSRAGAGSGSARWSADGQRVAFDSNAEGNFDIYVTRATGGNPIRLTTDPTDDVCPSWSRDGKWVYFISRRTGRDEVWKTSSGGGEAVPVTRNGGGTAFESPDGKSIYYIKGNFSGPLWKMPLNGGEEVQVLPSVGLRAFFLVNKGIYFIPERGTVGKHSIQFLSFATEKMKTVAPISYPDEGLCVSPDGRFLLFSQHDESGSDLMLVENFR